MLWRRQTWLSAGAGAVASGRYHSFLSGMNETPGFRAPCDSILLGNAYHVLLQEIERDGEQHDVLHQERDVAGHRRKSGRGIPTVRHEGDDRDGGDEGRGRTGSAENTEPLVPEAGEQERAECPFGNAEEPVGALMAEHGIEPPDQRTAADEWNEPLGLIGPPLLVTEEEKHDHHRGANDVVVEIFCEQAGPA